MIQFYEKLSAEVYDIDKYIGRSFGDVEFYKERLSSCEGAILEPGVGNGRIAIPLLESGMNVEGFDVSAEMLDLCRANCADRGLYPTLFEGNMESFSLETTYEAIIIPTGTFLLLHKREDSIKALKNFYRHLAHGGRLIIDITLQTDMRINDVVTRTWKTTNGDMITLETRKVEVDYINQYTMSHHMYEKTRNGKIIQTEFEQFPLRWYGVEEFKLLLQQIGFEDIIISANYTYGQYPTSADQPITFEATVSKK